MKGSALPWLVVTADQVSSRTRSDAVPAALDALRPASSRLRLGFDRTVGDEIQALTRSPGAVVEAVVTLSRLGGWRIGVGIGEVERPLPATTREARGGAYIAARDAVERARRHATLIALARVPASTTRIAATAAESPEEAIRTKTVRGLPYGGDRTSIERCDRRAEDALIVLRALLSRRTQEGWQAMQLVQSGLSNKAVASVLGVSESAVSQRLARAQRDESDRAVDLAVDLLGDALAAGSPRPSASGRGGAQ